MESTPKVRARSTPKVYERNSPPPEKFIHLGDADAADPRPGLICWHDGLELVGIIREVREKFLVVATEDDEEVAWGVAEVLFPRKESVMDEACVSVTPSIKASPAETVLRAGIIDAIGENDEAESDFALIARLKGHIENEIDCEGIADRWMAVYPKLSAALHLDPREPGSVFDQVLKATVEREGELDRWVNNFINPIYEILETTTGKSFDKEGGMEELVARIRRDYANVFRRPFPTVATRYKGPAQGRRVNPYEEMLRDMIDMRYRLQDAADTWNSDSADAERDLAYIAILAAETGLKELAYLFGDSDASRDVSGPPTDSAPMNEWELAQRWVLGILEFLREVGPYTDFAKTHKQDVNKLEEVMRGIASVMYKTAEAKAEAVKRQREKSGRAGVKNGGES